jgi:hypothetical protein
MIVGAHQPNYLPYLGFFDKMAKSDVFVIINDSQFSKGDYHNRNRIRIHEGWKWLTVPVEMAQIPINEIKIKNEVLTSKGLTWSEDHVRNIRQNYKDTPFYGTYEDSLHAVYQTKYKNLAELNLALIDFLVNAFEIDTEVVFSSDLDCRSLSTQRLVEILRAVGGNIYLSGTGARAYLDLTLFEEAGIEVVFQEFEHPVYRQRYEGFVPNMAAIDALFNTGGMAE